MNSSGRPRRSRVASSARTSKGIRRAPRAAGGCITARSCLGSPNTRTAASKPSQSSAVASSITRTPWARPRASAAATFNGSRLARASSTRRCFPSSIAAAATRSSCFRSGSTCPPRTRWSTRTSRCCGARPSPRSSRATPPVGPYEHHDRRRSPRRRARATAAAQVVGCAPPGHRRRDLDDQDAARRHLDVAGGRCPREPDALCFPGRRPAHRGTGDPARCHAAELRAEAEVPLENGAGESELLLLQGRPIAQPVVQHGPFVMSSGAQIQQAFVDYQRTRFGGWPWLSDDPVHGRDEGRFARHADGRVERFG